MAGETIREAQDAGEQALAAALRKVAKQNRAALRHVYDATAPRLFGICLHIAGDRDVAEDMLQDVYLKIWNRAARFDAARARPFTWLCAIARSTAIDWRRSLKRAPATPDTRFPLSSADMASGRARSRIFDCLEGLDEAEGAILRLAFFDGLSYPELAAKIGRPQDAVRQSLRQGVERLRACIDQAGQSSAPDERQALAAELALGVLDGEQRTQSLRDCLADPEFKPAMIDAWHRRLDPLYDAYVPVQPPPGLWDGVAARIDTDGWGGTAMARLRAWRIGALAAVAVAIALAAVLLYRGPESGTERLPETRIAVAQLVGAPDGPIIIVLYDEANREVSVRAAGLKSGRVVPELWVQPDGGEPRSLGPIAAAGASRIPIGPALMSLLKDGAVMSVTMEAANTMPHGAPNGPPVAAGRLVELRVGDNG